jgi:outer membrane protein OmpA-like peptidoglycan-associated protein
MKNLIALFFVLFYINTQAQNLVPNGGFESIKSCPNSWVDTVQKPVAYHWYSPDNGTPDYYNTCGTNDGKVPDLWSGYQLPAEGEGFAGIYNWSKFTYKEYLGVKLKEQLIKDTVYTISFSFANAKNSDYACFDIGLILSSDSTLTENSISVISSRVDKNSWDPITKWAKFETTYKASGDERHLFIGNFLDALSPDTLKFRFNYVHPMLSGRAYLYIDEVVIETRFKQYPIDEPFTMDNIYFEFDKAVLASSSFKGLEALASYLIKHSYINLEVYGFTDDVGDEAYNAKLSQERAGAVKNFLMNKGVLEEQIFAFGKGEYSSLEESEEVRSKNRKVEFILKPIN